MLSLRNIKLVCRLSLIMNYLWRRLWLCKEVTRDELIPCDALLCELMYHHDFDQRVMIYTVMLLCWGLLLYKKCHPLYVTVNEVWNAHEPHSREVHQHPDVICIQA